jgi:hypothetical protein
MLSVEVVSVRIEGDPVDVASVLKEMERRCAFLSVQKGCDLLPRRVSVRLEPFRASQEHPLGSVQSDSGPM